MVPSEGSPGSSLDLSSDVDVFPASVEPNGPSEVTSVNGRPPLSQVSATDNSPASNVSMNHFTEVVDDELQGVSVDNTVPQSGTLKRKREGSSDLGSPTKSPFTNIGDSVMADQSMEGERSQKRSQRSPAQDNDAPLQNGFHPAVEDSLVTGTGSPTRILGSPQLGAEIWQHVFSFVPPLFLGRLLRVNSAFQKMLTPTDTKETPQATSGTLPYRSANSIWTASRKRFCPGLPRPVPGLNDLQMWRLLRGNNCQICGAKKPLSTTHASPDPWRSGPGADGVRVFWAFGIRSCSPCMRKASEKEVTVLYSSTFPAFLMSALTCAFISQEDHLVASNELRTRSPPEDVLLTKVFFKPQMDEMKTRVQRVILDHGSAAVDEWIKGLDDEGRDRAEEVIRWENWEAKGGLEKVNARPPKRKPAPAKKQISKPVTQTTKPHNEPPVEPAIQPAVVRPVSIPPPKTVGPLALPEKPVVVESFYPKPPSLGKPLAWRPSEASFLAVPENLPQRPQVLTVPIRYDRTIRDIADAKAARRADIERRCMLLDPPLKGNVLQQMDAFQAAVQIPSFMTDAAWDVLKPRLLSQREAAENRENERINQEVRLQVQTEELRQQEEYEKDSKDNFEKEWEAAQAPIRLRLGAYADQMIKQSWKGGASITKENSPKFAVDVLLWARERFFDDQQKQDETLRAAGGEVMPDEPDAPPTRRLILENMKWLYENKIRPYTDDFQRDLFLCSSCDGKFYGFEAVIQHYAAKHTKGMSMGNAVVHWRADWPDQPPFNSNPLTAIASQLAAPPTPAGGPETQVNGVDPNNQALYAGQGQNTVSVLHNGIPGYPTSQYPSTAYPLHYQVQASQASFASLPNLPYQGLPANGQNQPSVYNAGSSYQTPSSLSSAYGSTYHQNGGQNFPLQQFSTSNGQMMYPNTSQATAMTAAYPSYAGTAAPQHPAITHPTNSMPQSNTTPDNATLAPTLAADLYNKQMEKMAVHAREVWFMTSGAKDIPHSVRIFIVIHQVSLRFAKTYTNEPSLSMFLDGLNHMAAMRPVRSVNGLTCATCAANGEDYGVHTDSQSQTASGGKRTFTLPLILNHFRTAHLEPAAQQADQGRKPDWRYEMIQLPDAATLANIVNAQGMDNKKLQLLSEVFPGLFPAQMPKSTSEQYNSMVKSEKEQETAFSILQKIKASQGAQSAITYDGVPEIPPYEPRYDENLSESRTYSPATARASESPGEDEYDPRRPEFLGRMVTPNSAAALTRKATAPENEGVNKPSSAHVPAPSPLSSNNYVVSTLSDSASFRGDPSHEAAKQAIIYSATSPEFSTKSSSSNIVNGGSHHIEYRSNSSARTPPKTQRFENMNHSVNSAPSQPGLDGEQQMPSSKAFMGSEAEKFLREFEASSSIRRPMPVPVNERFGTPPPSREDQERFYTRRQSPSTEQASQIAREVDQRAKPSMEHTTTVFQDQWSRQSSQPRSTPLPMNYTALDRRYQDPREQDPPSETRRVYEADSRAHYQQHDYQYANTINHANNDKTSQPVVSRYYSTQQPLPVQYRERSRSPRLVALPQGHYRQRSPVETAPRQEYYYQVPVTARAERDERQPVYYKYPPAQDEYTYVRDHQPSEALPVRRVEYIPVQEDEYALQQERYVIAHPAPEVGAAGERVRYIRYPQEHTGGGPYYADQAVYEPRQTRAIYQPMEGPAIPMQRPRY